MNRPRHWLRPLATVAMLWAAQLFCACAASPVATYELDPGRTVTREPQLPPNLGVGWFGGASIGQSIFHDYEDSPGDSVDDQDRTWSTFGGYQFNRHLGVVTGVIDHGKLEADGPSNGGFTDEIAYQSWFTCALGIAPVHPRSAVYALAGFAYWHQEVDYLDASGPFHASEYGFSPAVGAGVNWYLDSGRHFGFDLSWMRIFEAGDFDATGHDSDIDFFSLGFVVHQ